MSDDPKHNSLGGVMAAQLRAYVLRIERLQEEQDALGRDVKRVYAEIRAAGLDKKTIRKMVLRRRQDGPDHGGQDALLGVYEAAITVLGRETVEPDPLD